MTITQPSNASLFVMANNTRVALTAGIDTSQTTIGVSNIAKFSSSGGVATIYSTHATTPGAELVTYTGVAASTIIGVTRGVEADMVAKNALIDDVIVANYAAQHHNALRTSLQAVASEAEDLRTGVDCFTMLCLLDVGTKTDGVDITADTTVGGTKLTYNKGGNDAYNFKIGPDNSLFEPSFELAGDSDWGGFAVDEFRVYTKNQMETGSELGVLFQPGVANGPSAVVHELKSINNMADAAAVIFRVRNQNVDALTVYKSKTEVGTLHLTDTTAPSLSMHDHSFAPSPLTDKDVWLSKIGGTIKWNARIAGTTYSVTMT